MAKLTLLRSDVQFVPNSNNYRLHLEVVTSEGIKKEVFVKQRIKSRDKVTFDDVFVAIADAEEMESIPEFAPDFNRSHFRDNNIDVIAKTPEYAEEVYRIIKTELQNLIIDVEALNALEVSSLVEITAEEVTENMAISHTHYRIPLVAQPAGINTQFVEDSQFKRRVDSPNTNLAGWLPVSGPYPANTYFMYNIAKDPTVAAIFPPSADKIANAFIERNGVVENSVKITQNGIYWGDNRNGHCPWPDSYVNSSTPIGPNDQVILVLSIIV